MTKNPAVEALKSITAYINNKTPKDLAEAKHMLNLIDVIASETVREINLDKEAA